MVERATTYRVHVLRAAVPAFLGVTVLTIAACDAEVAPPVVDVHDEIAAPTTTTTAAPASQPTAEPADASTDSPYGPLDEAGYGTAYAYSPLQVCKQCGCDAGTYCFGGGTGFTTFSGTCASGGAFGIGCQPLPAACGASPSCDCLFDNLKGKVPCYLVCTGTSDLTAYCPTP
jgi:hypothetical protein